MFKYRIWVLATTACLGAFFFGYDIGFIGGATTLASFKRDFGITADDSADISGNVVASMQAGCFFGALSIAFLTDKIGRKLGLVVSGIIVVVASALQTAACGRLGLFYAGRVIGGLGVGAASTLVPLYVSETSPKDIRGSLLSLFSFFTFLGLSVAYWVDYACAKGLDPEGHEQWRLPVALQIIPAAGLCFGMMPLRESPRWLARQGRHEEAVANLSYIRQEKEISAECRAEFAEIKLSIEAERSESDGHQLKEIWLPRYRRRLAIGVAVMVCQQLSGTTVFTYYAPLFFVEVGIKGSMTSLLATGVYGIVKTVFSMLFLLWVIDRVGRRPTLLVGGLVMAAVMLINACVLATKPIDETSSDVSSASIGMIVLIYIFCITYSGSWGPVPWTYIGEIYPNGIREYCIAICSSALWAANFVMSKTVPIAIRNIGWKTFLMFGILNLSITVFVFFFVKETKGVAMERMDELFSTTFPWNSELADNLDMQDLEAREDGVLKADAVFIHRERSSLKE